MPAPTRILALNLGTQTISLAEFKTGEKGGLVLQGFRITELLADPAAEASRIPQSRIAIQEMMASLNLKSGKVNYAIAGQSVFTRFVKLPPVEESQVEQIITFEAQQNVPFPINEVVWDYQLVEGPSHDNKLEVVLVAIKADLLDDINASVESSGLATAVVDVAPMALYNSFRYNCSDRTGCSLLIDIGARTTNLIFVDAPKVFTRSIQIGGTTITAAIAKDFNEPFSAAEARKKTSGFVSLGGSYAEPSDPDVARVSKVIRNTMTRLHGEISRSITFYRAQQHGDQPSQVFLCGGSTSLPYMREFFQEKLQLPVEFFTPFSNVSMAGSVPPEELAKSAHFMGELVGLALHSISECPMELNLLPASVIRNQQLAERRPFIVLAGVCGLLCLLGLWLYYDRAAQVEKAVLENPLKPKVATLTSFQTRLDAVTKEIQGIKQQTAPFQQAVEEREFWVRIIDDLNLRLPKKFIWVTQMEPAMISVGGDGKGVANPINGKGVPGLRLRGLYIEDPDNPKGLEIVHEYLTNLAASPYFTIDLTKLVEVNPVRVEPTKSDWAFPYEFDLKLKKAINWNDLGAK